MGGSSRNVTTLAVGAAVLALVLAGCNNEGPVPVLTQAQADSLALVVTTDASALVEGSVSDATTGVPIAGAPGIVAAPEVCISKSTSANSDADPVPDSMRVTFTGCTLTVGNETATVNGIIDIIDPTPTTTDHALKTVYTDFLRSVTNTLTNKTRSVKENGTRMVSGDASTLQRSETNFTTVYYYANSDVATHVRTWSATFTADVAGTIRPDSLPNGNWNVTGTSTWTHGSNSYTLAVTTNPQLHYTATCTVAPRFDAGILTAVVTKQNGATSAQMTITVQFTACGQYTVTRS